MKNNFLNKIGNGITKAYNKVSFKTKQNAPEILLILGITTGIGCTVAACFATTKISTIKESTDEQLDAVEEQLKKNDPEVYSEQDGKKDTMIIYAQAGLKYAKLYAIPFVLGAVSVTSLTYSNRIMRRRMTALATAYSAYVACAEEYRKRVADVIGEEAENKLFHGIKAVKIQEEQTDENGNPTGETVEKEVEMMDKSGSPYAKEFDRHCEGWNEGNREYIEFFLRAQERVANSMLNTRGYIFLNDVYKMLGMEPTIAGQAVGWIKDEHNDIGDNKIEFDFYTVHKKADVPGKLYEDVYMIDFNVDGDILNRTHLEEI